jgi:Putative metallopeptidase
VGSISAPIRRSFGCALLCGAVLCQLLLGAKPVVAQPAASEPKARFDAAVQSLENEPRLKGLSHDQLQGIAAFTTGNILFVMSHELGHALIDDMYLYVLGREEDAADSYATVALLKIGSDLTQRALEEAAKGWFYSDKRAQAHGQMMEFYDEHGLDRQRAYQIICLMVGSNPEKFEALANDAKMPEDRQGTCQGDANTASWGWNKALKPYVRAPEQPKVDIKVSYGDAPTKDNLDIYANFLKSSRLLETIAGYAADRYAWTAPVALAAQTCGTSDAHWTHSTRTIVLCYEMAAEFAALYRDYSGEWKSSMAKGMWKDMIHKSKKSER